MAANTASRPVVPLPKPLASSKAGGRCKPPAAAAAAGHRRGHASCPPGTGRRVAGRRTPAFSPPCANPPWIGTPPTAGRFPDAPAPGEMGKPGLEGKHPLRRNHRPEVASGPLHRTHWTGRWTAGSRCARHVVAAAVQSAEVKPLGQIPRQQAQQVGHHALVREQVP